MSNTVPHGIQTTQGTVTAGNTGNISALYANYRVRLIYLIGTLNVAGTVQIQSSGNALTPAFDVGDTGPWVMKDMKKLQSNKGEKLQIAAATGNFKYYAEFVYEPR